MPPEADTTSEFFDDVLDKAGFDAEPEQSHTGNGQSHNGHAQPGSFDAIAFLNSHGVRIKATKQDGSRTIYVLEECVFDPAHKGQDAAVTVEANGRIGYKCFHSSCASYKWQDVRAKLDPGCYDHKTGGSGKERPLTTPRLVNLATVQPTAIRWLWPGRIPLGKLTVVCGEPGLGKSQWLLDAIARVTTGNPWPGNAEGFNQAGSAILLSSEDDIQDTIVPRLIAAGADRQYVTALQGVEFQLDDKTPAKHRCFNLESDLPALEQAIDASPGCRIIGIDPISSYLGGTDSHKNAELRGLLAPLAELAAQQQVAVVAITHLNKTNGVKAMHRITGSLAFVAAARAAWLVAPDKENPKRRLFLPIKNNLAAESGGMAFGIVVVGGSPALAWEEGVVNVTADEALREDDRKEKTRDREKAWIGRQLAGGPRTQEALRTEANETGFSWRTIRRAADDLGVEKFKSSFRGGWSWRLTSQVDQEGPSPTEVATFDEKTF